MPTTKLLKNFMEDLVMSANRDNKTKLKLHLMPPEWEIELSKVFNQGAEKYSEHNWLKGMPYSWCVSSAKRHLNKFLLGEAHDPETGCHHLAHAAWNLLAIISYEKRKVGEADLDSMILSDKEVEELFKVPKFNKKD